MTPITDGRPDDPVRRTPRVSCVMIFLDGAKFIEEAIHSVVDQEGFDDWELLLVDDGSTDASTAIARRWADSDPRISYLDHPGHENLGMSASRNLGIKHAIGEFICFLDCDDVWLPRKLSTQVRLLDQHPEVDATYGPAQWWYSWTGDRADLVRNRMGPVGVEAGTILRPPELMRLYRRTGGAVVPAICSVLARRDAVDAVGGFDDSFRGSYEDQVFYAKMGLHMTVLVTGTCLERYRQHPESACARGIEDLSYHPDVLNRTEERYLLWLESYLEDLDMRDDEIWREVQQTLAIYRRRFVPTLITNDRWRRSAAARTKLRIKRVMPPRLFEWLKLKVKGDGRMRLGRARRVEPFNRSVVDTRGTPVEDALVSRFLDRHRPLMRGRVLVVGSANQARRYFDDEVSAVPARSIEVADPSREVATDDLDPHDAIEDLSEQARYDCVVAVNVLQSVRHPAASMKQLHAHLAPGGTLLLTVPALVQRHEHDRAPARWGFAGDTVREMAEEAFGTTVDVETEGNALTAVAVIHGLPAEQFTERELWHRDDDVPVLITLRATRQEGAR